MEKAIRKIAVLGAESTGKTWLSEKLAEHFQTACVPEYARIYLEGKDLDAITSDDLVVMAEGQLALENKLLSQAQHFLFCDTSLVTLKIWAQLDFKKVPQQIESSLRQSQYDYCLITNNELNWVYDPLRKNLHDRDMIMDMNIAEVRKAGWPFSIVSGRGEDRLASALLALRRFT